MTAPYRAHADPPLTLTDRVRQLNDNLQHLAVRLKDAIATAVGRAVAQAVRDGVNALLGARDGRPDPEGFDDRSQADPADWGDDEDDPWFDPADGGRAPRQSRPDPPSTAGRRRAAPRYRRRCGGSASSRVGGPS